MGSIPGVFVGAFVLVGLPEVLREFAEYRYLVYGAVLVAMMLIRPEGLCRRRGANWSCTRRKEKRGPRQTPGRAVRTGSRS